jgi:hypothetical protein
VPLTLPCKPKAFMLRPMSMKSGLCAVLLVAACSTSANGSPATPSAAAVTANPRSHGGLDCQTGVGFRNIDNHKADNVHPGWSVEVLLSGETTYSRHFDWQSPQASPSGVLVLKSARHAANGGLYARWLVRRPGTVRITVRGVRLSPSRTVPGEASRRGLFEVTLTSSESSPVPGCPPLPSG